MDASTCISWGSPLHLLKQKHGSVKLPIYFSALKSVAQNVNLIQNCELVHVCGVSQKHKMGRVKRIWYLSPMRTSAARSYKQWVKRNLQTESQIAGPSEWPGMRSYNLSWQNAWRHKFAWRGSNRVFLWHYNDFGDHVHVCTKTTLTF